MFRNIPIYEALYTDGLELGLFGVSLVDNPAIKTDFLYFNEQQKNIIDIKMVSEDKREIISPILIPNQLIYRRDESSGQEFYVRFGSDVIKDLFIQFASLPNKEFSIDHNHQPLNNIELIEMWLSSDDTNNYGYDLPNGTFFVHLKINDDKVWKMVKDGSLKGLSIEAQVHLY